MLWGGCFSGTPVLGLTLPTFHGRDTPQNTSPRECFRELLIFEKRKYNCGRRGTEAVITAPTRNRMGTNLPQGFESLPLRQFI